MSLLNIQFMHELKNVRLFSVSYYVSNLSSTSSSTFSLWLNRPSNLTLTPRTWRAWTTRRPRTFWNVSSQRQNSPMFWPWNPTPSLSNRCSSSSTRTTADRFHSESSSMSLSSLQRVKYPKPFLLAMIHHVIFLVPRPWMIASVIWENGMDSYYRNVIITSRNNDMNECHEMQPLNRFLIETNLNGCP